MGMNEELAAMYNTPGHHTSEDQTKLAEAELFAKLAAENGINLNDLSDEQVEQLWNSTFDKQAAEEECPKCHKAKGECKCDSAADKVAAAAQVEFEQQQEWKQKVAECDKLGRVMAHAYVQELTLIDEAMKKQAGAKKVAEMPPQFAAAAGGGAPEEKKEEGDEDKKEEKKDDDKDEEKEASAIDVLAAKRAVVLAKEAKMDEKLAAKRVDAVLTLGLATESTKTASAKTLEETVHVRALELLEKAGYQVNWK